VFGWFRALTLLTRSTLATLPADVRLDHDGQVLREVTGITWTIANLPASPQ
jgi:hypothetical protein